MPTKEEVNQTLARAQETIREISEVQERFAAYDRQLEEITRKHGTTVEEMRDKSRQLLEKIRQEGTPEQKAELEAAEVELKERCETRLAQIEGQAAAQSSRKPGSSKHRRVREMI